ncbi:hypothetical protein ACFSTC_44735 [Nonomuraea ferruginea]
MAVRQPRRVAWEAARIFVPAAATEVYWWLSEAVGHYLGVMYELKLAETRLRLAEEPGATPLEIITWRISLDELLGERPGELSILAQLAEETADRIRRART